MDCSLALASHTSLTCYHHFQNNTFFTLLILCYLFNTVTADYLTFFFFFLNRPIYIYYIRRENDLRWVPVPKLYIMYKRQTGRVAFFLSFCSGYMPLRFHIGFCFFFSHYFRVILLSRLCTATLLLLCLSVGFGRDMYLAIL